MTKLAWRIIPWLTRDIDGDPRPNGPEYDIGADEFVCLLLSEVTITGPATGTVGIAYNFTAVITPTGASSPITYTWTPEPDAGQSSAVVTYTWMTTGTKVITVTAENCGGLADDSHVIVLGASPHWHVYLPLLLRDDRVTQRQGGKDGRRQDRKIHTPWFSIDDSRRRSRRRRRRLCVLLCRQRAEL